MANYVFVQDSGSPLCNVAVACSGRSLSAGTNASVKATVGGSADLGVKNASLPTLTSNVILWSIACEVPSGVNQIDAQTIAVNWRQATQSGGTPTINEIHLCRLDSGCSNLGSLGSVTGLTTVLSATGLFTQNLSVASAQTVAPGDVLLFVFVCSNSSSMSAWSLGLGFNPETSITIAMSEAATAKVNVLPLMGVG